MYIGISIATVFILLCLLSKSIRDQFRFLLIPLLILLGACLAYYGYTGKSPAQIPRAISNYFNEPQLQDEASHKYYQDPAKQYGDQVQ